MKRIVAIKLNGRCVQIVCREENRHHFLMYDDALPILEWAKENSIGFHIDENWFMMRKWIAIYLPTEEEALLFYLRFQ